MKDRNVPMVEEFEAQGGKHAIIAIACANLPFLLHFDGKRNETPTSRLLCTLDPSIQGAGNAACAPKMRRLGRANDLVCL